MPRITAIITQKGGTAKTTTAHALTTGLILKGCKTLAIDADPQGNLSYTMRADPAKPGLYEAMRGDITPFDAIQHTAQGDIIASSLDLAGADMEFTSTGREYIIREMLEPIIANYTHIIIDSPPSLGIMTVNAMTAATDLIIPACPSMFALQGLQQLLHSVERVRKYSNPNLAIAGVLVTRKGARSIASAQLIDAINTAAGARSLTVYDSIIREATAVSEAQILRASLYDAAPKAKVTDDYRAFIDEYLMQEG